MRITRPILAFLVLAAAGPLAAQGAGGGQPAAGGRGGPPAPPFMIQTRALVDGGTVPLKYTQADPAKSNNGSGMSPQLGWINPPAGTQSFVVNMHDMEVARNKGLEDQAHWVVWNIPGSTKELPENIPAGSQIASLGGAYQISASGPQYRGPGAPATGAPHHYMIEVYALDVPSIAVKPGADAFVTRKAVIDAIQGHVLGKALIVGLFKRPEG
jgi:Raf kinase inhibitor-like YbhB/YbcL family protein